MKTIKIKKHKSVTYVGDMKIKTFFAYFPIEVVKENEGTRTEIIERRWFEKVTVLTHYEKNLCFLDDTDIDEEIIVKHRNNLILRGRIIEDKVFRGEVIENKDSNQKINRKIGDTMIFWKKDIIEYEAEIMFRKLGLV